MKPVLAILGGVRRGKGACEGRVGQARRDGAGRRRVLRRASEGAQWWREALSRQENGAMHYMHAQLLLTAQRQTSALSSRRSQRPCSDPVATQKETLRCAPDRRSMRSAVHLERAFFRRDARLTVSVGSLNSLSVESVRRGNSLSSRIRPLHTDPPPSMCAFRTPLPPPTPPHPSSGPQVSDKIQPIMTPPSSPHPHTSCIPLTPQAPRCLTKSS
jgi:hypothetical protein